MLKNDLSDISKEYNVSSLERTAMAAIILNFFKIKANLVKQVCRYEISKSGNAEV